MILLACTSIAGLGIAEKKAERKISLAVLEDKIRGGWAGQMIGVSYGAPTEFRSNGKIYEAELKWSPDMVSNSIRQDDLYVEMTFAAVLDREGLDASSAQFGEMFKNSKYSLWHANAAGRRLLNNRHQRADVGPSAVQRARQRHRFPDRVGLHRPHDTRAAAGGKQVLRAGREGDELRGRSLRRDVLRRHVFGGLFRNRRAQGGGTGSWPPSRAQSEYGRLIRDLLDWSASYPDDWRKTWQLIEEKWDKNDSCPDGAFDPFNIDAKINGAYVALGLLYGKGDFARTLEIATRSGQDSDCNPSSAAGVLGVMLGYSGIPDVWKSGYSRGRRHEVRLHGLLLPGDREIDDGSRA